jgi:hypothetical protein
MKAQLKKLAQDMFEAYPDATVFVVTTDNQFFFPEQINLAQAHQEFLNKPKDANDKLIRVTKEEAIKEESPLDEGGKASDDETPDNTWKLTELKDYCAEKGIALDGSERSKDVVLLKIAAAQVPAPVAPSANEGNPPASATEPKE